MSDQFKGIFFCLIFEFEYFVDFFIDFVMNFLSAVAEGGQFGCNLFE